MNLLFLYDRYMPTDTSKEKFERLRYLCRLVKITICVVEIIISDLIFYIMCLVLVIFHFHDFSSIAE